MNETIASPIRAKVIRKENYGDTFVCTKCHREKPIDEFYLREDGRRRRDCKLCVLARNRRKDIERPHGDPVWRRERSRILQRKYGITIEEFDAMAEAQFGRCALCGEVPPIGRVRPNGEPWARLNVDHDHACCPSNISCGLCVRGLVCGACNTWLGRFEGKLGGDFERIRAYLGVD
jgi:hypothetical protein